MKYVAIFLAVILAIGVGALFLIAAPRTADRPILESSPEELAELQENMELMQASRTQTEEELSAAHERILELEAKAVETDALLEELRQSALEAKADEDAETDETGEVTDESEREISLDEIRAKLRGNAAASTQIKGLTELVYADFLNGIDVEPDVKAELRRLLHDSLMESMALSQYAMREGDVAWSDVTAWQLEERAFLDDALQALLPDDAFETWNMYTEDFDALQLEGNLRNQIRAFASGLTPENFEAVMQVAVEEFRAQQIALEQSNTPFTLSENIFYQIRAMTAMRERLFAFLPEDQMAEIENWLTMGENLLTAQLPRDTPGE